MSHTSRNANIYNHTNCEYHSTLKPTTIPYNARAQRQPAKDQKQQQFQSRAAQNFINTKLSGNKRSLEYFRNTIDIYFDFGCRRSK